MIGSVASNNVDVTVVVDDRRRIGHPHTTPATGPRVIVGIGAPHISRSAAIGEFEGVKGDDPTGGGPLSFAATERDHQRLRTARFGRESEAGTLDLAIAVEGSSADVVAVDED